MLKRLGLLLWGTVSFAIAQVGIAQVGLENFRESFSVVRLSDDSPPLQGGHASKTHSFRRVSSVAYAQQPDPESSAESSDGLTVVYPPGNHETTAEQIFLIGSAPPDGTVTVNGEAIARSPAGHFAPSFPLDMGDNQFTLAYGDQTLTLNIRRQSQAVPSLSGTTFAPDSLYPSVDIARQPGELICFEAIAPVGGDVTVQIGDQRIDLMPQRSSVMLPPNSAVLTLDNQPIEPTLEATLATDADAAPASALSRAITYQGCGRIATPGLVGAPEYALTLNGERTVEAAPGTIEILSPTEIQIAEVTSSSGAARTGASTSYSRLTPLPTGTQAAVTGRNANWFRLDYGAWIRDTDVSVQPGAVPPRSLIRSIRSQTQPGQTQVLFPLQVPIPVSVEQTDDTFTLILHNTTAQTDTIFIDDDPLIRRLDWYQPSPDQIRYRFQLKTNQQWGYDLRYDDTTLVLTLRHPPAPVFQNTDPLAGISVLLDPGHGGDELGARGPTGYPEKDVNLVISRLLRDELINRGATVYMTRNEDIAVSLGDRMDLIQQLEPTLALSIHYNALPDSGDAINTAGIGTFWYHSQAHDLAVFLHDYLVEVRDRPSYGVFWNNLALTRPAIAPSVLLELGFMINPNEFEWIVDPEEQAALASALADGITAWVESTRN